MPCAPDAYRHVQADLEAIEQDETLGNEANFIERAEAIDALEFRVIDQIAALPAGGDLSEALDGLMQRAQALRERLAALDVQFFDRLQQTIRAGHYRPSALKRRFKRYADLAARASGQREVGFDSFDAFVNGLLRTEIVPEETLPREPDMVRFEPTPARVVLELVEAAAVRRRDVFYDLGSGLGQVVILVHLLSGAQAKGVEFEPAYCRYARQRASSLDLTGVTFINQDARDADYADGTIFFMYTPFKGQLLQTVLQKLEHEAIQRTIKICTYGPCTGEVANSAWLKRLARPAKRSLQLAVFESVRRDGPPERKPDEQL